MPNKASFISQIKTTLKEQGLFARKAWGQHFLIDPSVLSKILEAAELEKKDLVLEVGTGLGTLTLALAQKARKVLTVEKDERLSEWLRKVFRDYPNVVVKQEDILKIPPSQVACRFLGRKYKIVANLPYYLTSRFLKVFLQSPFRPVLLVVMVQREVAGRITAFPPRMNLLALSAQFYGRPKLVQTVSRKSFWPSPQVDSAIVKIVTKEPPLEREKEKTFWELVRIVFSTKRKQLLNALKNTKLRPEQIRELLLSSKIEGTRRAESLDLKEWLILYKEYEKFL